MDAEELTKMKFSLENRLAALGIKKYKVTYLKYLDYSEATFQSPYDVGCRLFILYGLVFGVQDLEARPNLINWFKRENIWDHVSDKEREFLVKPKPDKKLISKLSWGLEGAFTLGWALRLIDNLPSIERAATNEEIDTFLGRIPELGDQIHEFLSGLNYRNLGEIYEENLVNELATSYFRDLLFNGEKDETKINRAVSFERHQVLNWTRQFSGIKDWDSTDTST